MSQILKLVDTQPSGPQKYTAYDRRLQKGPYYTFGLSTTTHSKTDKPNEHFAESPSLGTYLNYLHQEGFEVVTITQNQCFYKIVTIKRDIDKA